MDAVFDWIKKMLLDNPAPNLDTFLLQKAFVCMVFSEAVHAYDLLALNC